MRRILRTTAVALALVFAPAAASAQLGIAPKAGTAGVGADIAIDLSNSVSIRGGFGTLPVDLSLDAGDISYDFTLPTFITAGIDIYPAGSFRLTAGVLIRQGDFEAEGQASGSYTIGNMTFSDSGTITGSITNSSTSPYVGIGFGKHTSGFGFFLDLGVAFAGDPEVSLTASDNLNQVPGFAAELQVEANKIQADLRGEGTGEYVDLPSWADLSMYPVIQLGLKLPLGSSK